MNVRFQPRKNISSEIVNQREFSRILTAAVVDGNFRRMLLSDPAKAISRGYGGENFNLVKEDRKKVASIRASSLADFARQLSNIQRTPVSSAQFSAGD
jgi:hypothetical protein